MKLIFCDIYRDGGSLEGVWETDEQQEWAVTLDIQPGWEKPGGFGNRSYKLYNCAMDDRKHHTAIQKNSPEHIAIVTHIADWMTSNNILLSDMKNETGKGNHFYDLWEALQKGNF